MDTDTGKTIVVIGATGRQGGATARALLNAGWRVRAVTRNPASEKAKALSATGAEVVKGEMDNRASLQAAFRGAYGVFSVQNSMFSTLETEVRHGKQVADAAKEANVHHLVYASAGIGTPTGIDSWDAKLQVEAHIRALGLPVTILRPLAFMELFTDKGYYPQVSTWHLMPRLMGDDRPVGWIGVNDVGIIAEKAFAAPDQFVGRDFKLASDVKSIAKCRTLYREATGKNPPRFPMPIWLFKRFVGTDLITMWQWLRTGEIDLDTSATRTIHPDALSVEAWLHRQKALAVS